MISFKNVTKRFGTRVILDDVSLDVHPEEFVCITGPSGAGKSTMINLLIGRSKPSSGEIVIDDVHIEKMNFETRQLYRRKVGIVFQDYKLLLEKTVYENVAFALEACGEHPDVIESRVPKVLDLVGLLPRQHQYPRELSGGEQQRTAIARALVHNPNLLIADEPTGNLDKITAKSIVDLILSINASGTTVVFTTHNEQILKYINKRVIVLEKGKITMDAQGK